MKGFLKDGPAIAAGIILQHGFELENNLERCREKIENYRVHGGDRGLTEREMRKACELPPAPVSADDEQGMPVGIILSQEGASQTTPLPSPADASSVVRRCIIKHMLDKGYDSIRAGYFKNIPLIDVSSS